MKNKLEKVKNYIIIILIFLCVLIWLFVPNLEIIPNSSKIDVEQINLWLVIYGGIVAIFMGVAFYNMFNNKQEFSELKDSFEEKTIKLEESYQNKVSTINVVIEKQSDKLKEYSDEIDNKTNFIMNYIKFLKNDGKNNVELIKAFEHNLISDDLNNELYEILTTLCFSEYKRINLHRTFNKEKNQTEGKYFHKGIYYLNKWIEIDTENISDNYKIDDQVKAVTETLKEINERQLMFDFNNVEIMRTLEKTRKNLMNYWDLKNYKDENIVAVYLSGATFTTYIDFLEQQIDFQIGFGVLGVDPLIKQLVELIEIEESDSKHYATHRTNIVPEEFSRTGKSKREILRIKQKYKCNE